MQTLITKNPPEKLLALAQKWNEEGKSFYLGPENLFYYKNEPINYKGESGIPRAYGSWFICTEDTPFLKKWNLSEEEINDISDVFAQDILLQYIYIYINYKCNAKCAMCGYHCPESTYAQDFSHETIDVPFSKVKQRLDKGKELGCTHCAFVSHGELLLNPEWKKMVEYAASLGMSQYFISNGFLFTQQTVDFYKKLNCLETASFSLHTNNYETWKKIFNVNNKKLFDNAMQAPILAKEAGIAKQVVVTFVLQESNKEELNEFVAYWKNKVDTIRIIECQSEETRQFESMNSHPIGLCMYAHTEYIYVNQSGAVTTCCPISQKLNNKDRDNYGFLNFDTDSIETIKNSIQTAYRNKNFYDFCKKCPMYANVNQAIPVQFENDTQGYRQGIYVCIPNDRKEEIIPDNNHQEEIISHSSERKKSKIRKILKKIFK